MEIGRKKSLRDTVTARDSNKRERQKERNKEKREAGIVGRTVLSKRYIQALNTSTHADGLLGNRVFADVIKIK